jgi:ABC-2 type transport system ATP-binding protein
MIEVEALMTMFGSFTAVDHISFSVVEASIHGLFGPNGTAKPSPEQSSPASR